jgi:two-component system OmpR family response regulator
MSGSVRILVIDDDESIRDFTHTALAAAGYDVVEAADGATALDLLGSLRPDVILLDMLMPGMDGWAFARSYHQTPGPHALIIVVTAARDAGARVGQINAAGCLAKPFRLDALFASIAQVTGGQ